MDQEIQLLEGMERMRGDPGDHVARKPEAAVIVVTSLYLVTVCMKNENE